MSSSSSWLCCWSYRYQHDKYHCTPLMDFFPHIHRMQSNSKQKHTGGVYLSPVQIWDAKTAVIFFYDHVSAVQFLSCNTEIRMRAITTRKCGGLPGHMWTSLYFVYVRYDKLFFIFKGALDSSSYPHLKTIRVSLDLQISRPNMYDKVFIPRREHEKHLYGRLCLELSFVRQKTLDTFPVNIW